MNNELNYSETIENYKKGNIKLKVELAKARAFLMNNTIYTNRLYVWTFFNSLLFPIAILILSIMELGVLGGIIFSVVSFIIYFGIHGTASIHIDRAITMSLAVALIGVLVKYFFHINCFYSLILIVLQCFSVCIFYKYIGKTIINKILLIDEKWFKKLYGELFYISK